MWLPPECSNSLRRLHQHPPLLMIEFVTSLLSWFLPTLLFGIVTFLSSPASAQPIAHLLVLFTISSSKSSNQSCQAVKQGLSQVLNARESRMPAADLLQINAASVLQSLQTSCLGSCPGHCWSGWVEKRRRLWQILKLVSSHSCFVCWTVFTDRTCSGQPTYLLQLADDSCCPT